jgi:pSer/pThr/pTyr-binding forkhead associated (FHA) protein
MTKKALQVTTLNLSIVKFAKLLFHVFIINKIIYLVRFNISGNDRIYDMIDIIRPINQNYIILESLNQLKDNNNIKSIHVINLNDQKITLGRGHECDVRINDISVSRTHASIIFNSIDGRICIRDLKSKFGTLVLLKNNLLVREKKMHLQIGRTYLEAHTIASKECDNFRKQK